MTLQDVIDHHLFEARRHHAIAGNWTASAMKKANRSGAEGRPNAVRDRAFHMCARAAMTAAQLHLDMAHALSPMMGGGAAEARA